MVKVAFIFPGQGSQKVGMGRALYDSSSVARKVYEQANKVLNKDIASLCFKGPDEKLKQTINAQLCIVATSIAALEAFKTQLDITPYCVAGHSLGESSAMYAAGVMDMNNAFKYIQKRAELMSSLQKGSMLAVLKATPEQIDETLQVGGRRGYIDIANYNSPKQIVLTGCDEAIQAAKENLSAYPAVRTVLLPVSGAFHSEYMKPVSEELSKYIKDFEIKKAQRPVITNIDAEYTTDVQDFATKMPKQLYSSVQWTKTMEKMRDDGVDTFIEFGNGQVLSGLLKQTIPDAKVYNVSDKESLEHTVNQLKILA